MLIIPVSFFLPELLHDVATTNKVFMGKTCVTAVVTYSPELAVGIRCRFYSSLIPELISVLKSFLFKHDSLSLINLQLGGTLVQ